MNFLKKLGKAYYDICRQTSWEFRSLERLHPKFWHKDFLMLNFINKNITNAISKYDLKNKDVLDLGSANKPYKPLFDAHSYTGVDFFNSEFADIKADLNVVQDFQKKYDILLCFDTLEHVKNTAAMSQTFIANSKAGSFLFITTPFFYQIHDSPYDYHRFTRNFYAEFLTDEFELVETAESNFYPTSLVLHINTFLYRLPLPYFFKYPFYTVINILAYTIEFFTFLLLKLIPLADIKELARSAPLEYFLLYRKR